MSPALDRRVSADTRLRTHLSTLRGPGFEEPQTRADPRIPPGSGTMNMAPDVEALRDAGEPFDRALTEATSLRQQSGIDAAKAVRARGQRPVTKQIAQDIIAAQVREVDQMRQRR